MSFPKDFIFGAATASYQIEGAWDTNGKGENIWDHLVHTKPEKIKNRDNGDVSCDSYNLYKEDVKILKDIGFQVYRFSISWSRILPTGDIATLNEDGLAYYHKLIDELLESGIEPMVTMYHWDLPQKLQDIGGWMNPLIADYMEDYADILFKNYGSKVKWWITINEPIEIVLGYANNEKAPLLDLDSPGNYIVAHNILRSHGKIYRLYDSAYRKEQKGKVSITISATCYKEKTDSNEDIEARDRAWAFLFEWFANPIYSKKGDYPVIMREIIDKNSKDEGRRRSRLPTFTEEERKSLKGSADFFGVNNYTTRLCSSGNGSTSLWSKDVNVKQEVDPSWPNSHAPWLKVVPCGFRNLLHFIKEKYDNPPIFITENGYCSTEDLNDIDRISYYKGYLTEMLNAMNDIGCNVIGYTAWSLLDNFEWMDGFDYRFGLVHVDFNDPQRKRTPRKSAAFFKKLLETRVIPLEF